MNVHDRLIQSPHEELMRAAGPRRPGSPGLVRAPRGLTTRRSYRRRAWLVYAGTAVRGLAVNRGINGIAATLPAGRVISRHALTYHGRRAEDAAISSSAGVMQVRALRVGSAADILEGAGNTPASFAHDYKVLLDTFRPRHP